MTVGSLVIVSGKISYVGIVFGKGYSQVAVKLFE
jgi:hypothetical protein